MLPSLEEADLFVESQKNAARYIPWCMAGFPLGAILAGVPYGLIESFNEMAIRVASGGALVCFVLAMPVVTYLTLRADRPLYEEARRRRRS